VRITRPLVIAALAASLVAAGGTAASASTNSPQHFRHGQEYFVLWTSSPSNTPTYALVAHGVFNGFGVTKTVSATSSLVVLFTRVAGGTYWTFAKENGTSQTATNPYTCRVTYTSYGNTYQIKYGTGRLWGLFGWGTYSIFAVQTVPRLYPKGPCNFGSPYPVPGTTFTIIHASGPVFLPKHHKYY